MAEENKIPPLSESYQKARKSYGLFAALLLAWELIGLGLEAAQEPGGIVKVTVKSPQAAPYVLLVLVLFFAFRITIEWMQCDEDRRSLFPAKIDYWASHTIGVSALLIFGIQRFFEFQVADQIWFELISLSFLYVVVVVIILEYASYIIMFRMRGKGLHYRQRAVSGLNLMAVIVALASAAGIFVRSAALGQSMLSLFGAAIPTLFYLCWFFLRYYRVLRPRLKLITLDGFNSHIPQAQETDKE